MKRDDEIFELHEVRGRALPVSTRNLVAFEGRQFRPSGPLWAYGDDSILDARNNPIRGRRETQAARVFVGFNVAGVPRWRLSDLIRVVLDFRPAGATFLATRGLWKDPAKGVEQERGAQIIIVDTQGIPGDRFQDEIVGLSEHIADKLEQDSVLVEMQLSGRPSHVLDVTAR